MPIKGISGRRRLPRLGKIRLGEKKINKAGAEYPSKLDYFNCPPEVQAVYGEKPRELEIMFPVDSGDVIFPQFLKRYGKSKGLVCKGDGETAVATDETTGEMTEIICDPDECEYYGKRHCRRVASLQFMLPRVPGFGVWQIDTTSYNSIVNLNSCFDMIRGLCGQIAGIPLVLKLEPKDAQVRDKTGTPQKQTVFVMTLGSKLTVSQMLGYAKKRPAELMGGDVHVERPAEGIPEDLYPNAAPKDGDGGDGEPEPAPVVPEREVKPEPPRKSKEPLF
jgi:hypothetical protein